MKLPANPKTRAQVLLLAGVGVIVLLILAYLGLSTIMTERSEINLKLDAASAQLKKIDREIKALPALRQNRDDLFWTIQHAATNYILFHEYRNYLLTARETLLPLAAEMAITIDIPKEGVVDDFPAISESKSTNKTTRLIPRDPKAYTGPISPVFALYPVSLTGRAGFVPLLAFLRRLESVNPYLTISELSVKDDPKTPEEHDFSMTLLWPIWKNLEQKPKVEELISPTRDYGNTTQAN